MCGPRWGAQSPEFDGEHDTVQTCENPDGIPGFNCYRRTRGACIEHAFGEQRPEFDVDSRTDHV